MVSKLDKSSGEEDEEKELGVTLSGSEDEGRRECLEVETKNEEKTDNLEQDEERRDGEDQSEEEANINKDRPGLVKDDKNNFQGQEGDEILIEEDNNSCYGDAVSEIDLPLESNEWLTKKKHVFILSESGKPIYTRYGCEDNLVTLYGLLQALVSIVQDEKDVLHCVEAGGHKFAFLVKSPLILATVDNLDASVTQLLLQLMYINSQVESVSTRQALQRTYNLRPNCDLRDLLGGTDRLITSLVDLMERDPGPMLGAYQCFPLPSGVRAEVVGAIQSACAKIKDLVMGLVLVGQSVAGLVRLRGFYPHPADILLLSNLVSATDSLRVSQHWMPICLPQFDPNGYLYGHVSYLSEECDGCLLLMTVAKENFFILSQARTKIMERLKKNQVLEKLVLPSPSASAPPASAAGGAEEAEGASSYTVDVINCPELRHFVYKSKSLSQFTAPLYGMPYSGSEAVRLYSRLHQRLNTEGRNLKMLCVEHSTHAAVAWVTDDFELFALIEPLTTKQETIAIINRILKYVRNEENRLFILSSPIF